jgi:hypothetical protein
MARQSAVRLEARHAPPCLVLGASRPSPARGAAQNRGDGGPCSGGEEIAASSSAPLWFDDNERVQPLMDCRTRRIAALPPLPAGRTTSAASSGCRCKVACASSSRRRTAGPVRRLESNRPRSMPLLLGVSARAYCFPNPTSTPTPSLPLTGRVEGAESRGHGTSDRNRTVIMSRDCDSFLPYASEKRAPPLALDLQEPRIICQEGTTLKRLS